MHFSSKVLASALVALLLVSSCKKDKSDPNGEPQQPRIVMTKTATDNTPWELNIDAAIADRPDVWVDLNYNGRRDTDEGVTEFKRDISSPFSLPATRSKTIAIYGKVTMLGCSGLSLNSLDLSQNKTLDELDCAYNVLTSLNVTDLPELKLLYCEYNGLTALDVSKNTKLTELVCLTNKLTLLDVSKNTALAKLLCFANTLTTLDVSNNPALVQLLTNINALTSLDLSQNKAIKEIDISKNKFTAASMKQLIASLPMRSVGDYGKVYVQYSPDNNTLPAPADIAIARAKNWLLYKMDSGWKEL